VDLLSRRTYLNDAGFQEGAPVPDDMTAVVEEYRAKLVEAIVETDDELTERYLSDEHIDDEMLHEAYLRAVHGGLLYPVLPVSAASLVGTECLLDLMVGGLRSPQERGALTGVDGQKRDPVRSAPTSARVWRTTIDPFVGKIAYVRVWSGVIRPGDTLRDTTAGTDVRPAHLYVLSGKDLVEVPELEAGAIGAFTKIADVHTGDTLCDPAHPIDFGPLQLPEPVMTVAIHAASRADEDKLGAAMTRPARRGPHAALRTQRRDRRTDPVGHGRHPPRHRRREARAARGERQRHHPEDRVPRNGTRRRRGAGQAQETVGRTRSVRRLLAAPLAERRGFRIRLGGRGRRGADEVHPEHREGRRGARTRGVLAGYPVQNVRAVVFGGSYHDVDSSDLAFKTAAGLAFRAAMEKARPTLLEPVVILRVRVPGQYTGDVIGDLQTRRARVQGMEPEGTVITITALTPLSEVQKYSADLRSLTGGRGAYSLRPAGYQEVPAALTEKVVAQRKAELAAG
jgi:elongation factor G